MKIYSNNIVDGCLQDAFGKRGQQFINGVKPSRSFHLAWSDLPKNTQSLALSFVDYDAIPVCGFSWIHWTVANLLPDAKQLPENASEEMNLIEGVTSWHSPLIAKQLDREVDSGYGGCAPPDCEHTYTLTVYALDAMLTLERGFYYNELLHAIKGHVLAERVIEACYAS